MSVGELGGNACKLCGGPTGYKFTKRLLKRFDARYHECRDCGSLQVLAPDFLAEAYRSQNWALDTGLVARNVLLAAKLALLFEGLVGRDELIVDYGGGTGLLTRLLRDMGWNVRAYDKHGTPQFVSAFHLATLDGIRCKAMIASEVLEHFDRPKVQLEAMLSATQILVFTTELYRGQDESWWYLAPFTGQHIFFWSAKAIAQIFGANDVSFLDFGFIKLGVKNELLAAEGVRSRILAWAREAGSMKLTGAALKPIADYLADPFRHVGADYQAEIAKYYARDT